MKRIRVLIAENHTIVRQGLKRILEADKEIKVVEQATDGVEAVKKTEEVMPDVVIMDLRMPEMSGSEATRIIKREWPSVRVIMLSMFGDDRHISESINAGADSYLLKENSAEQLVRCIKDVHKGESFLTSTVARKLLSSQGGDQRSKGRRLLTPREQDILGLLARGKSNTQIADTLYISESTVRNHISNVYEKLNCKNRAQATREAIRRGMVDLAESQ